MSPTFTVIIPAFNIEEYLPIALGAIVSQTFNDWECICVDDGSTDDTAGILEEWELKDARIHVMKGAHEGVSVARNMAIDVARGEYLVFLDGDDAYVPNALEYLFEKIVQFERPDIITYGTLRVSEHTHYSVVSTSNAIEKKYGLDDSSSLRTVLGNMLGGLIAWNACWRREAIEGVRFEKLSNGEDVLWGMHCMMIAKTMLCSTLQIHRYLYRPNSAVNSFSLVHARSAIQCVRRMTDSAGKWNRKNEAATILFRRILSQVLGYVRNVISKLPHKEKCMVKPEFVAAINHLCMESGLLQGWQRRYFQLALTSSMTRLLLLYIPFDLYAWKHRGIHEDC